MLKIKDFYVNGEFKKRVVREFPDKIKVIEIGEILASPKFEDVVYEDNLRDIMKLIINELKEGKKINLLFSGQQGTGKTLSSKMIAAETGKPFIYLNGNESKQKIKEVLLNAKSNSIVLIDEIQGLRESVAEIIYPAIQDNEIYSDGLKKSLDLMFIATTTEPEKLPKPLLDRFKRIEFEELSETKLRELLSKGMPENLVNYILNYTHNFRVIKGLMEMIKMYGELNEQNLVKVFRLKKINLYSGMSDIQEKYIEILKKHSKPVGLRLICLYLRKSEDYMKLEVEPDLIRKEIILITSRGRELNPEFKDFGYSQLKRESEKSHVKFTSEDKEYAINWIKERNLKTKRYSELVNEVAEMIHNGECPDGIDWSSFADDIPIKESKENNYLMDL